MYDNYGDRTFVLKVRIRNNLGIQTNFQIFFSRNSIFVLSVKMASVADTALNQPLTHSLTHSLTIARYMTIRMLKGLSNHKGTFTDIGHQ